MKRRTMQLVAGLILSVCGWSGCASSAPAEIRILSYNIHHGEGLDGKLDLARIAQVIRDTNPDLVALQEVDRGVTRSHAVDQPAELARLTGMHPVFEKNIPIDSGEYGNAVLSRYPVVSHRNHHLPQVRPHEQRGLLEVQVQVRGEPVTFYATHFDYRDDDTERMASISMIREQLREQTAGVTILAGDLNSFPDSRVLTELATLFEIAPPTDGEAGLTFPADKPDRRIDYVLYRGAAGMRCVELRVIPEAVASDHRPVLAVIHLPRK